MSDYWIRDDYLSWHLADKYPRYGWLVHRHGGLGHNEKYRVRAVMFVEVLNMPVACIEEMTLRELLYMDARTIEDVMSIMAIKIMQRIDVHILDEFAKVSDIAMVTDHIRKAQGLSGMEPGSVRRVR